MVPGERSPVPRIQKWLLASLVAGIAFSAGARAQQYEFGNHNTPALVTLAAAGAGTTDSPDQDNQYGRGLIVGINVSAKSGTIAVTVAIQGKDAASGTYYAICQSASLVGTGFSTLTVYPGTTASANSVCNAPLPRTWRIEVVSGTGATPSVTMTVDASVIL